MRHFWQNCPKTIEATSQSLTVRLFPNQGADVHELQAGEQKTHTIHLAFGPDRVTDQSLDWCRSPMFARISPQWYADTGAVPYLVPAASEPGSDYLRLVDAAIEGDQSFAAKREVIDEYGWRNFGDVYADHEAIDQPPGVPLISHYNNQYDGVAGFAIHLMRTGDRRWWELLEPLAAHVVDIDIYHTDQDKSAYNGGFFWHSSHYIDAGRSTHRSYSRDSGVPGGGPSAEHNYSTGLMLQYFLTGDERYRDAVLGLARWVIDMDDGDLTVFRWLARGPTGWATATASLTYHGPGRGAGYSITTLLNAHQLTGDARFLIKAEEFIRRCIHPSDDVESRELLDTERRWSYTVFLQTLGRYLDWKAERQDRDVMFDYARASLLHYARWMALNERPYLDRPDVLDRPTETWAAQDMRKSEVFTFAARCGDSPDRERFVERAESFFRYSVETLAMMPTRSFARPLTLMLTNGYMHAWWRETPDALTRLPEASTHEYGRPQTFVPQKIRAKGRLVLLASCLLGLIGLGIGSWIVRWMLSR
jgi:hypothetical protein